MISSADEARLVLNKWIGASTPLMALATSAEQGFVVRMKGVIESWDKKDTFCFSSGEDFIVFNLGSVIGYDENVELPDEIGEEVKNWKAMVLLKYHNGERLVLCTEE